MKRIVLIVIILAAVVIGSFVVGGLLISADFPFQEDFGRDVTRIHEQESISDVVTSLHVDSVSADVTLRPGDVFGVVLEGEAWAKEQELLPHLEVSEVGDEAFIVVEYPRVSGRLFGVQLRDLKLIIDVPHDVELFLDAVSADVRVQGVGLKDCRITTVSEDISLRPLREQGCSFSTVSGDIEADSFSGEGLRVNTSSGDVWLHGITGGVGVRTVSGDVDLSYDAFTSDSSVDTTSGDVVVSTPSDASYAFIVDTVSGSLMLEGLGATVLREQEARGMKGAGNYELRVQTVSGDVRLT